jgi:hypothetical protein
VRCRCWQDGLASAPPVPRELIVEDEGRDLDLSVPYDGNEDLYSRFDHWVAQGLCAHKNMNLVSARIANWAWYRLFQRALGVAGWQRFPTLHAYLPQANGGTLPAAAASAALAELRLFEAEPSVGSEIWLVDEDAGERLNVGVPSYGGVIVWDGWVKKEVGVDAAGLFVLDTSVAPKREEFRALRCTQEVIGDRPNGKGKLVRLTDAGTSAQVTLPLAGPVGGGQEPDAGQYPRHLRVESVPVSGADFHSIVEALTVVLSAAESSGNPVVWC